LNEIDLIPEIYFDCAARFTNACKQPHVGGGQLKPEAIDKEARYNSSTKYLKFSWAVDEISTSVGNGGKFQGQG
jgi:hypothetical protein